MTTPTARERAVKALAEALKGRTICVCGLARSYHPRLSSAHEYMAAPQDATGIVSWLDANPEAKAALAEWLREGEPDPLDALRHPQIGESTPDTNVYEVWNAATPNIEDTPEPHQPGLREAIGRIAGIDPAMVDEDEAARRLTRAGAIEALAAAIHSASGHWTVAQRYSLDQCECRRRATEALAFLDATPYAAAALRAALTGEND